jgi:hypothetical protein
MFNFAMVLPFSPPDPTIYTASAKSVYCCTAALDSERDLRVVEAKHIMAVVAIVPMPNRYISPSRRPAWFIIERPGLDVLSLRGDVEVDEDDENLNE